MFRNERNIIECVTNRIWVNVSGSITKNMLAAQFNTDDYFVIFYKNGDGRTVQQSIESGSVVLLLLNRIFPIANFKINLRLRLLRCFLEKTIHLSK